MAVQKITLVGAGKMATAIASGLLKSGMKKENISAFDISPEAGKKFEKATSIPCAKNLKEILKKSDAVLLAVKPQYAREALAGVKTLIREKLLISICAGLTIETLKEYSSCSRIVRVMPNTPALAGEGMSAYAFSPDVRAEEKLFAEKLLSSIGICREVPERLLDAVTGLSGSGPAYVIEFILALTDGGVYAGLPRDAAYQMALQTVSGTAAMLKASSEHPAVLRDAVISPGGTTARGVAALDAHAFRKTVMDAVIAAAERSAELNRK
ncbi:MAG: pyrroline-5-carboxylate reductase [Lentisphaeria bacterium]|nr:pyrroline-5-carboxylate reductase [Lentisphaeria bacterium]